MKICCYGSCNVDHVYRVAQILRPGETGESTDYAVYPGGKGLNQALAAARSGAEVSMAGAVGPEGDWLRQLLAEDGVDVSDLRQVETPTGHAVIQVSREGQNAIVIYHGANFCRTPEEAERVLSRFGTGDVLILQNEINCLPEIVRAAKARGMRILLNPSPISPELEEIDLGDLWCLMLNEVEILSFGGAGEMTPEARVDKLTAQYPALTVVLTLGERGSLWACGRERIRQPAYAVRVADTTAAGDTFCGFFAGAIAEGDAPLQALRYAAAASSLAVSRPGAASSIPTRAEVLAALPDLRPLDV